MNGINSYCDSLLLEISLNLENAYEWHALTPRELKEKIPDRWDEFYRVYSFSINEQEYLAAYMKNREFHFFNYTNAVQREDGATDLDLNMWGIGELMKLASTLFSIMQFAAKYTTAFIIVPPEIGGDGRRKEIYLKIIKTNYKKFLPNYEIEESDNSPTFMLYLPDPHKSAIPEANLRYQSGLIKRFNQVCEKQQN